MREIGLQAAQKPRVFISYSRTDLAFADQLVLLLEWLGFPTTLDRTGIHGAEKWEERLGQIILEADVVVFVVSPESAGSKVCGWEVQEAARRGKRIVPILCRPLQGTQPPAHLQDLNYIYFYSEPNVPGSGFGMGQIQLEEALSVNVVWLREHTRLEELAERWDRDGRSPDQLLRGSELSRYRTWRDQRPTNAPLLTNVQRTYLAESDEQEKRLASTERQRLDEIAAAQAARQVAIEERETALRREAEAQKARIRQRKFIAWGLAAVAMLVVAGALGFAAERTQDAAAQAELRAVAELQKASVVQLIERIRVAGSTTYGIAAMRKICDDGIQVTQSLATQPADGDDYAKRLDRFWQLYFGPMNLIEMRQKTDEYNHGVGKIVLSRIESAMVEFGWNLKKEGHPSCSNLTECAENMKRECEAYLE